MTRFRPAQVILGVCLALGVVVLAAAPAAAHVEPDPVRVEPGDDASVSFLVEHGCDDSPTTKLTFKIPKGAKNVEPGVKDGWSASVTGKTVVFENPSNAIAHEDEFTIAFTAPSKKAILVWKVVQKCEDATIRWIDTAEGAENPPPRIGVGKNPPADEESGGH